MADPPPIRRATTKPPPIPPVRAPIAPAAAKTDVVPHAPTPGATGVEDLSDDTRNVEAPDAAELVERIVDLVASEAEALLAGDDAGRLADLYVRNALASWDALHEVDEALRLLELADGHPLVPRLRLSAAIAAGDEASLVAAERALSAIPAVGIEVAEAWLWRHRKPEPAAAIADRLLAGELPGPWKAHVVELATLAHAAAGNWARVVALRVAALDEQQEYADPEEVAATAALMLDRGGDAAGALARCWAKLEHFPGPDPNDGKLLGWLRTFDVAIDAATVLDDVRRFELLDKRAELVAALPGGAVEAFATRHAVASELERDGQLAEAAAMWMTLADDPVSQAPGAGRRVALLRAAWAAIGGKAEGKPHLQIALGAHRKLSDSDSSEIATTHAWRALELAAVIDDPVVGDLARAVVDAAGSVVAERWLDELEITGAGDAAIARYEGRGGLALRWAAAIAERKGDVVKAKQLWAKAAQDPTLHTTRDHLLRLLRGARKPVGDTTERHVYDGDDRDELSEGYVAAARAELDLRCTSALWCACGIVDLTRGDFVAAEESLQRAAEQAPGDPFARAALAAVYRAGKRYDQLAAMLDELTTRLHSREARAATAREHAELLDEHLGDPAGARQALERMIADRPDDADAMLVLARLCDRDELWARSIELRTKAVELVPATRMRERGEIWLDIARTEERRDHTAAALAALEHAAEAKHPEALREQARLLRGSGDLERALAIVRAELATDPPLARRMQLQSQLAQLLTELGREPEAVVAAYLDILGFEPDQTEALAGIEAPARELEMWDELARAFRGAPQTPRNLEVLAEALAKIAEWSELAEVRRKQLEAATTPADKARRAAELARLYDHELGDVEAAVRMLVVAQAAQYDESRQQELIRLLRDAERWHELATVLERELPAIKPTDVDRQVAILLELAELRATKLDRIPDAITAYESVLERRPHDAKAPAALEALYEKTGRDRELARLVEARAEAAKDPVTRSQLFARVAQLRGSRGDVEGALAAYTAAFNADPANREVFTAMERVCYKAERWAAAMQLYETALRHVESGASRAYRLGDLYARRGNVQLNFLGQVDAAIASYQKVVEVDSQPVQAIKALEELCTNRKSFLPLVTAYERRAEAQREPQRKVDALRAAAQLVTEHGLDAATAIRIHKKLLALVPNDPTAQAALESYFEDAQDRSGLVDVLKMKLSGANGVDEQITILKQIARASEEGARDVETATEYYQKVLALRDNDREALEALGRIYESTEQWAEFIEVTRKQIKVTTDRNTRALLYFRCGSVLEAKFSREHDAIRYYHEAIKTSSACLPAVHGLRDLYRRREEWPRVIETLELEVKLWADDKERAGVFAQIGRIYEKQLGDVERAMQFYDSALAVDAECLPANQALFDHYFDKGEWQKAHPIATGLAQKAMRDGDPIQRSEFFRKRGVVAKMTGDPRGAADSIVYALEIRPTNVTALDDLGALAREWPDAWDFDATYRELDKLYKKRDDANPLLARVHVGRAAIIERAGDLDQAADHYRQALELAPGDIAVLSALVGFHADMRHWREAVSAIERFVGSNATSSEDRLTALMRQVQIHADGEMEPMRAIAVLREVIKLEPGHQDAYYLLAQQCFLIGRHADARNAIDRVIELATAPGQPLEAPALARYYYYKGRILDAAGDARSATSQYRRAIDYDPGYAPPALVLARRAADAGDQRQAETLLIDAAHAAMAQGGPRAAVPLQRGLARILLASGDRAAAIEAYRGILNVEPDGAVDRVALAEIYAVDDPQRAIAELRKVLDRDIHHAPAYRLLASFHNRIGDTERAHRVLTALDLLGFAEETDRTTMQRLRAVIASDPFRRSLDDGARDRYLLTPAAREPLGEVFSAFAQELSNFVAQPSLGQNLQPIVAVGHPRLLQLAAEIGALFQVDPEIFVAEKVPGLVAVTAFPRRLLVIDRVLLDEPDPALRFLLGYAFEAIRGGYATLLQVGARQRRELAMLLRSLLAADVELTGPAAELVERAGEEAVAVLERHAGARDVDPSAWADGMLALAKRGGLLACDDFSAAIWMVARLAGERLASHDATVALGAVLGGPDLVRFYLSDDYQHLRDLLTV
ncbi:MAG TPA: tetratricopeptide repeat protein [Kofleriaceae bacterium]|nr:tetratricopeptide repeat protein [Kofleriaceae bacterium]